MKSTLLLAALAVPFVFAPALHAAPETGPAPAAIAPAIVAPALPAPQIDARAMRVFEAASEAYAKADGLSQNFNFTERKNGEIVPDETGTGTWSYARPRSLRLDLKVADQSQVLISDGATVITQRGPAAFTSRVLTPEEDPIGESVYQLPGATSVFLASLLDGQNPLAPASGLPWRDAKVIAAPAGYEAVELRVQTPPGRRQVQFRVYFDARTHLIARLEAQNKAPGAPGKDGAPAAPAIVNTNVVVFQSAAAPANFEFALPDGARLATEAPRHDLRLVTGAQPFALSGQTLAGQPISLDDYKGKVVLLDFWATWCGPCRAELPNVQAAYDKYRAQGFEVLGVSLDEDEGDLRAFVKAKKMEWPEIFDVRPYNGPNATAYGVTAIPFSLLIGKDGVIAAVSPRGNALAPAIEKALAG